METGVEQGRSRLPTKLGNRYVGYDERSCVGVMGLSRPRISSHDKDAVDSNRFRDGPTDAVLGVNTYIYIDARSCPSLE